MLWSGERRILGCPDEGLCVYPGPKERVLHPVMSLNRGRWDAVSKVTGLALGVRGRIPGSLGNSQV